jgi:hypothetical protein
MTPDEYITERVDGQIGWYDQKSQRAQRWFKRLRGLEIIAAAAIPLIAGFGGGSPSSVVLVGVLGAIVVIITSLLGLNQFQENWIEYRTTCESLRHEKYFFLTNAEPYHEEGAFDLFVQRIESLISKENSTWSQYTRSGAESSNSKEKLRTK